MLAFLLSIFAFPILLSLIGLHKLFEKAGVPAWKAFIPFYNIVVAFQLTKQPRWWVVLFIFPGVNLLMFWVLLNGLARAFGKTTTSDIAKVIFVFFIFVPKMAFDPNVKYIDPSTVEKKKKSVAREWTEAIVFAVVAVTVLKGYVAEPYKIPSSSMEETLLVGDFLVVSKLHYGVRPPQTPLYFPMTHNNFKDLPGGFLPFKKSYLDWWKIPYLRFFQLSKVKNNDIVVFNFPANDTTIFDEELIAHNYHDKVAEAALKIRAIDLGNGAPEKPWETYEALGAKDVQKRYEVIAMPVDKRSNYVKRCVAIPGDQLEVREGQLFVNNQEVILKNTAFYHNVHFKQFPSKEYLHKLRITKEDMVSGDNLAFSNGYATWILTNQQVEKLRLDGMIDTAERYIFPKEYSPRAFPQHIKYNWSMDNFGPISIPKKGETVQLTIENLPLYRTIIRSYEKHLLEVKDKQIYIDGQATSTYTFEMDYYFMMGDNRHNSADSRVWGFVPEDHIVGKAMFIWMSTDDQSGKGFPGNIRWDRIFKPADN